MKSRVIVALAGLAGLFASSGHAGEPHLEFIDAMRRSAYFDYALLYLDDLRQRPDVPADVTAVLSYEEYRVHQDAARLDRTARGKEASLEKSLAALERFVNESPSHPLAAEANSARAGLFLDKAKALIWASQNEQDVRKRATQQEEARAWIAKARPVYQAARDQFEKALDKWKGVFLDPQRDAAEHEVRRIAEQNFIQAQINLAMCTHQEARTHDVGSEPFKTLLKQAAEAFEAIHDRYRSQGGGLYARIYQGKCFEEQGELGRALGIYDEILGHPAQDQFLKELQARTFYFKLIVLNRDEKKDFKLVMSEATRWLTDNRDMANTPDALGIQLERARACEILSEDDEAFPFEADREGLLQQAYNDASQVALYAGEFRDRATSMMQRLEARVKGMGADPKDFGVAFSMARGYVTKLSAEGDKVNAAKTPAEKQTQQAKFDLYLAETERIIRLGLSLADEKSPVADVAEMRYYLAYTFFASGKLFDAAVTGTFIARTATPDEAEQGQKAANLALACLGQLAYDKPEDQLPEYFDLMRDLADLIVNRWPESGGADDAQITLANMYTRTDQPLQAAESFDKISPSSSRYNEAQMNAGQRYWVAYASAFQQSEDERPDQATLDSWVNLAFDRIQSGLALTEKGLSSDGKAPDLYYACKVTLAEIFIKRGQEAEALKILTEGDRSVLKAIAVPEESKRPERGPQSRPYAVQVYQALLRSYMGTQQIDQALTSMNELEAIAGSDKPEALTNIYIELGLSLKKEIDQLQAEGNAERLGNLLKAFDAFLGEIYKRKDSLNRNVMLWVAESYSSLGEGVSHDPSASEAFFRKASDAYADILDRAAKDPAFLDAKNVPAVQVRIASLKKKQGQYQAALDILVEVVNADDKMLQAQFEIVDVLKAEAESGDNNIQHYQAAIQGNRVERFKGTKVNGLVRLVQLLQQVMASQKAVSPEVEKLLHRGYYELAECLYLYGKGESDNKERAKNLNGSKSTITKFVLSTSDVERETWNKFDALYQQVLKELGEPVTALPRPQTTVAPAIPVKPADQSLPGIPLNEQISVSTSAAADKDKSTGPNYLIFAIVVIVALAVVGGVVALGMKKPKRRTLRVPRDDDAFAPAAAPSATSKPAAPAKGGAPAATKPAKSPAPAAAAPKTPAPPSGAPTPKPGGPKPPKSS